MTGQPTAEDRLEYAAAVAFVHLAQALPPSLVWRMSQVLGAALFDVARYRRGVLLDNLAAHLDPSRSETGGPRTARLHCGLGRRCLANFAAAIADLARLPLVDRRYVERHILIEGRQHLDRALGGGRGAVLVTGHFGSWELMGCAVSRMGYPVKYVVGLQRNPLVQRLMNDLRRSCGIEVIEPGALLAAARALRRNQFVAMLPDQDVGERGEAGVFVDFLGERASTPRGAAQLSILAQAPVIPGFIVRTGPANHRVVIEPAIEPPAARDETGIAGLTAAYTRVIEAYVRRYPDHWLWSHRRWKTRP